MPEHSAEKLRERTYIANVEMELAETPGKFIQHSVSGSEQGHMIKLLDEFGHLVMEEVQGRNSNTNNSDVETRRRWMKKPRRSSVAPLIDPDDRMSTSVDLGSPLVRGVARAARSYHDDQFLCGFYQPALDGGDDEDSPMFSVPFSAQNILAADYGETAGNYVGLNLLKLRTIRKLARKRFVNLETDKLIMAVTAEEIDDLLAIDQFTNGNYADNKALEHGEIRSWMGFTFIPAEIDNPKAYPKASKLVVNGLGHRRIPIWVKSGMHYNSWLEFKGHTDILAGMNHSEQIAGYACGRGTRRNEDMCFIMECAG